METFKTIFSGQLMFGNERSFEQIQKMYLHRKENYYRNDILLDSEEIFDVDSWSLKVPRFLAEASIKSWRNTLNLLEYTADFAIAGEFRAWRTESGKMLESKVIEPDGDKAATQAYLKGRKLVDQAGKEEEATKALNRAIDKFARHATAYERRGYINYRLKNYKDAHYDFSKSIDINPINAAAYYGRARVLITQGDLENAIPDLALAIKRSIPHQSIYWIARRIKGDCHKELGQHKLAATEYRLFTKRKFDPSNPNYDYRSIVFQHLGEVLLELGEYADAVDAFNSSIEAAAATEGKIQAERLLLRGIARQKAGEKDFAKDWKEAAGMGSEKAAELLEAVA